ncbi:hypothetical protein MSP8886_02963 [Marinomonas spartinae]|uniref:Uncharacterized protein n=1 Tax=Marinomonas spartinae TaxID=1792290 RepID=A0A1A8TJV9_9GAMM|nr:hypothetical protein [Marinomonas spartinae]SBS34111.1 hypothetical protein MSP8886_02963 [Marinomonas spartinae]
MSDFSNEAHFWLGAPKEAAQCIFLMPNKPVLPLEYNEAFLSNPNVPLLIELNGNHWRKIFTIMAKLLSPSPQDWRYYRDERLFSRCAIVWDKQQLMEYNAVSNNVGQARVVFIVGNSFRQDIAIDEGATIVGEKQQAAFWGHQIWCPYLDYRQFPNRLIAELRHQVLDNLLESPCYKH